MYSFFDLLGDYGGFEYIFYTLFVALLAPFAEQSYNLEAIKSLYLIKSGDQDSGSKLKTNLKDRLEVFFGCCWKFSKQTKA